MSEKIIEVLEGAPHAAVLDAIDEVAEAAEVGEVLEEFDADDIKNTYRNIVQSEQNVFNTSIFPVLFLDKQMRIVFANTACKNLFSSEKIEGSFFIDVFKTFFALEDLRGIRETILNGKNGFSWKGQARIKSTHKATLTTKAYLFPAALDPRVADEFIVMFDDITEETKKLLRSVFMSLLEASKLKDNDTGKHIVRVNFYSDNLARKLFGNPAFRSVDADFIDNIGFLAAMHDVGKIGTPDDILNKEGPLTEFEWTIMREHTKNGAFILSTYPNPMAKEIALSHHERWDGKGYPFQLEGPMIPLAARIVSIADVYDALRMKRSYKDAFTHEVAVQKLNQGKGTQFDPNLVDIFNTMDEEFNKLFAEIGD
jgi:putative two-component system response regulator